MRFPIVIPTRLSTSLAESVRSYARVNEMTEATVIRMAIAAFFASRPTRVLVQNKQRPKHMNQ